MRHSPPGGATPGGGSKVQRVSAREVGARKGRGVRLPYRPGLDGLRALAVIAVLLYHAGLAWIPGGFLGVEVFFVISGYLITALLLAEWRGRGRIDLKSFWLRRARRLLPALYVLLVVTLAYAVVFLPGEVAGLRADALAAFGYVTNWYLVFGQESYFEAVGRPSLLKHLWSLAVEEQFYLLWPLIFAVGMGVGATRLRARRTLTVAVTVAVASAVAMALLYVPGVDPSRIYYGTDTRATGLLFGAALAFLWSPGEKYRPADTRHLRLGFPRRGRFRRRWGWIVPTLLDLLGIAALGGLVWFCLKLGEFQPFLYRGGFALVALMTAAAIMVVVHPHTRLGARLLGWGPLRWVGERSYGIYLWHWPVFMVTRPGLDVPFDGMPLLALRLAATILLAHLSYEYVEAPIRRGALGRAWNSLRQARGSAAGSSSAGGPRPRRPSWRRAPCSASRSSRPSRRTNPPTSPR
ncbi:MAG: acyltransferase [Actinomycetota bacterium]|nr:acyltransferase [Actinomycetota bacterium]